MSRQTNARKSETVKVIEVIAQSKKHWKGPVLSAAEDANEPLQNIKAIWLKSMQDNMVDGKIKSWSLNCTISFEVEEPVAAEFNPVVQPAKTEVAVTAKGFRKLLSFF